MNDRALAQAVAAALHEIDAELEVYAHLLRKWQPKLNLVGRSTLPAVWTRHFADSAQLAEFSDLGGKWADLGSGAGFPGMVLALLQKNRSVGEMHLIESDARKAAFLREVSRETGARAYVHHARCEDALGAIQPSVIVSRAMASLAALIGYSAPFVEKGAIALFLKGRDIGSELTDTPIPSSFAVTITPSKVDKGGSIVRIQSI